MLKNTYKSKLWISLLIVGIAFVLPRYAMASTDLGGKPPVSDPNQPTFDGYMYSDDDSGHETTQRFWYTFKASTIKTIADQSCDFSTIGSYPTWSGCTWVTLASQGYIGRITDTTNIQGHGSDKIYPILLSDGSSLDGYRDCNTSGVCVNHDGDPGAGQYVIGYLYGFTIGYMSGGDIGIGILPDETTRFIAPQYPLASSTVATSSPTTIGGYVYVNADDYVEGKTYVRYSFTNQTASLGMGSALEAWNAAFGELVMPVTSADTAVDVSTSTTFGISPGKSNATYQIYTEDCPWYGFGFFCSKNILVSTTTYFYVGQKTQFDIDQEAGNLGIFGLSPGSDAFNGTTTNAVLDCDIGVSFDIYKCLWSFVVPNPTLVQTITSNFTSLPVLGWPIRFVQIIWATEATTSLPTISYTFASSFPVFGGMNIHFDPWQYLYTTGSMVKDEWIADDGSGKNIWDIMAPFVNVVVYLTLLFVIVRRITGLNWGSDWNESESINVSSTTANGKGQRVTHTYSKRRKL